METTQDSPVPSVSPLAAVPLCVGLAVAVVLSDVDATEDNLRRDNKEPSIVATRREITQNRDDSDEEFSNKFVHFQIFSQ